MRPRGYSHRTVRPLRLRTSRGTRDTDRHDFAAHLGDTEPRGTMPVTVSVSPSPRTGPGRPDLPEIILHLGAQRTGSTRLQYILDANRDALAAHATVALTPPRQGKRVSPTIRDVLALTPTGRYRPVRHYLKRRRARAMLRAMLALRLVDICRRPPPRTGVILSDETMLGPRISGCDGFGLYPSRVSAPRRPAQAPGPSSRRGPPDASGLRHVPASPCTPWRPSTGAPCRFPSTTSGASPISSPSWAGGGRLQSSTTWPARLPGTAVKLTRVESPPPFATFSP